MAVDSDGPTPEFRFRASAFAPERTYRLDDRGLAIADADHREEIIPYDDFVEASLAYAPTRFATGRYRTTLRTREGRQIELFNVDYRGFAEFAPLDAEYRAFVTALHRRLAANGGVSFRRGNRPLAYAINWLLTIFVFAIIIAAGIFFALNGLVWLTAVKLVVVAFFIPTLIRFMRKARPGGYDPLAIAADVLPQS